MYNKEKISPKDVNQDDDTIIARAIGMTIGTTMTPGGAVVARELRVTATFSTGETPTVPAAVVLAT